MCVSRASGARDDRRMRWLAIALLAACASTPHEITLRIRPDHNYTGIYGVVRDPRNGKPLIDVNVSVDGAQLSQTVDVMTDDRGRYRVEDLPPGFYLVTFAYEDALERIPEVLVRGLEPALASSWLAPAAPKYERPPKPPQEVPSVRIDWSDRETHSYDCAMPSSLAVSDLCRKLGR
jgi:hypothetical protein